MLAVTWYSFLWYKLMNYIDFVVKLSIWSCPCCRGKMEKTTYRGKRWRTGKLSVMSDIFADLRRCQKMSKFECETKGLSPPLLILNVHLINIMHNLGIIIWSWQLFRWTLPPSIFNFYKGISLRFWKTELRRKLRRLTICGLKPSRNWAVNLKSVPT